MSGRINKRSIALIPILLCSVVFSACTNKYFSDAQIGDGIAIFYPDNFVPEKMLPSFALLNEPSVFNTENGTMPENCRHRGGKDLPAGVHLRYHNV